MRNPREPQQARLIQLVPPRPQTTTPLVPAGYAAKENKRAPSPHKPAPDSASPALVPTRHLSHEWRDPPPDAEPTRIDRQSNPPHPRRAPQTLERGPVRAAGAGHWSGARGRGDGIWRGFHPLADRFLKILALDGSGWHRHPRHPEHPGLTGGRGGWAERL
jgi:hypothetical protein